LDVIQAERREGSEGAYSSLFRTCIDPFSPPQVTQLCGVIMELAAYHHGDESLKETIVNLAQDFMGSNNINLMAPLGQYGSRERVRF
jgi:hypothetical protein